jgi:hypothetical protein
MQLEVVITAKDLDAAEKLMRRWYYWPRLIFANLYYFLLLAVMIWGFFYNLFRAEANMQVTLLCFLIAAAMIALWVWRYRRGSKKRQAYLDGINPIRLSIESGGITTTAKGGSSSFTPWSEYSSFRDSPRVFLLVGAKSGNNQILPKGGLSATDAERLRSLLAAQIA